MIDEGLRKAVQTLAWEELQRASKIHPPFADPHHGYAVIKEEIEECENEMNALNAQLNCMWNEIKNDAYKNSSRAKHIKLTAVQLALEAIQVAAMAQKIMNMEGY